MRGWLSVEQRGASHTATHLTEQGTWMQVSNRLLCCQPLLQQDLLMIMCCFVMDIPPKLLYTPSAAVCHVGFSAAADRAAMALTG